MHLKICKAYGMKLLVTLSKVAASDVESEESGCLPRLFYILDILFGN